MKRAFECIRVLWQIQRSASAGATPLEEVSGKGDGSHSGNMDEIMKCNKLSGFRWFRWSHWQLFEAASALLLAPFEANRPTLLEESGKRQHKVMNGHVYPCLSIQFFSLFDASFFLLHFHHTLVCCVVSGCSGAAPAFAHQSTLHPVRTTETGRKPNATGGVTTRFRAGQGDHEAVIMYPVS